MFISTISCTQHKQISIFFPFGFSAVIGEFTLFTKIDIYEINYSHSRSHSHKHANEFGIAWKLNFFTQTHSSIRIYCSECVKLTKSNQNEMQWKSIKIDERNYLFFAQCPVQKYIQCVLFWKIHKMVNKEYYLWQRKTFWLCFNYWILIEKNYLKEKLCSKRHTAVTHSWGQARWVFKLGE